MDYEATCFSTFCNRRYSTTTGKIKKVTKGTTDCPDCKHALFWSIKGQKKNNVSEYKRSEDKPPQGYRFTGSQ